MLKAHRLILCLAFWTSVGCTHSGPTIKMLEERAEYDAYSSEAAMLEPGSAIGIKGEKPFRENERRIADVWVYPHQAGTREYFGGGWVAILLEGDRWEYAEKQNDQVMQGKRKNRNTSNKSSKK